MEVFFIKPKDYETPPEPRPKRKHVMTPARLAAARANAQLSTGPKDTSRTRFNRATHGCCCELPVVMPGEDAEEVQNKVDIYITELGAQTQAEKDAIELSVLNYFRVKRVHNADIAAETRVVGAVQNNFDDRQRLRCDDLVGNLASSPAATIIELESFTHGISWILGQIELLEEHLQTSCSFHPSQRVLVIHLFGRKLQDLFTDAVVRQSDLDYLSGLHGPGKINAAQAASLFWQDRPADMDPGEFERRLGGWLDDLVSIPEGHALLKESLAEVKARLLSRLEEVEEREAIDLELATQEAMVSVNADCMKRLRYRRESERGQQAGMRQLHQLQLMRLKHGEALGATIQQAATEAGPTATAGPPEASLSPAAGAEEVVHRTEAAVTQAAGGASSNDKAPRTPGSPGPDVFAWTPQQIKEFVANQRRKRAAEQQRE
jgi:hypothetical protein